MRSFSCHYRIGQDGNINKAACWGGVSLIKKPIYICDFDCASTRKYQKLIVDVVNEITTCKFVSINDVQHIEYNLLSTSVDLPSKRKYYVTGITYNKNLILLSFIRNLWHEPFKGYSVTFFESLSRSKRKDPMERLTWANKQACKDFNSAYSPGHSNVHKGLKVKTLKQFHSSMMINTMIFLTSK